MGFIIDFDHNDGTQWQEKYSWNKLHNSNMELSFLNTLFGRQSNSTAFSDLAMEIAILPS